MQLTKDNCSVFAFTLLLACTLLVCSSCSTTKTVPRTEILLSIDAGSKIQAMANQLRVELSSGPADAKSLTDADPELFDLTRKSFQWPASVALVAKPSHADYVFAVSATAEAGGKAIARARVKSSFVRGKTLVLELVLQDACLGKLDCTDDETCVADGDQAACQSASVDSGNLNELPQDAGVGLGSDAAAAADGGNTSGNDAGPTEDCWNGKDDDADGDIDCTDSDCRPVAVCVPEGERAGALVAVTAACPAHFDGDETTLHQSVKNDGCTGCSCNASTECLADVHLFSDDASCANDAYSAATYTATIGVATCDPLHPAMASVINGSPTDWGVSAVRAVDKCTVTGTPKPAKVAWNTTKKLCEAAKLGKGCAAGEVCVPKPASGQLCTTRGVNAQCSKSGTPETWFGNADDTRTCDVCTCASNGSDCTTLTAVLGHNGDCTVIDSEVSSGKRDCALSTLNPAAYLRGNFTAATCSAHAASHGSLTPVDRLDLCCTP